MYRYIAIVLPNASASAKAQADRLRQIVERHHSEWDCVCSSDVMRAYQTGSTNSGARAHRLGRKGGVVLGTIFRRPTTIEVEPQDVLLDSREVDRVVQSRGRHLMENYWGRYVALMTSTTRQTPCIIRDPTGAMPCFLTTHAGVHIIFSHMEDCIRLGAVWPTINWEHIAAYLWFDHLVTEHTGLNEVRQIQAGQCVELDAERISCSYLWDPVQVCQDRIVENRKQAIEELTSTIQYCVRAWTSGYKSILHELSGGIDSTLLLCCMRCQTRHLEIVCENHFTDTPEGDERQFARLAAASAKTELLEVPIRPYDCSADSMFDKRKVPTPALTAIVPMFLSDRLDLVKARRIEAIFSGQGGDHFFQSIGSPHIAAEFVNRHGLGKGLFGVISDTCKFSQRPFWSVLSTIICSAFLNLRTDPYDIVPRPSLLSDAACEALNPKLIRHPWIDNCDSLPYSKLEQIFGVIETQNFFRFSDFYADIVHPLISQPIIELCLQIPSYVLTYGGADRALIRDSFRDIIPGEIVRRTGKGATTGYFNNLLVRDLPFVRKYLLGGLLVSKGILDQSKTNTALSEASLIRGSDRTFPVLDALRAEFWLRTWLEDSSELHA